MIDGREFARNREAKWAKEAEELEKRRKNKAEKIMTRAIKRQTIYISCLTELEKKWYPNVQLQSGYLLKARFHLANALKKVAEESHWQIYELSDERVKKMGIKRKKGTLVFFIFPEK